MMDERSQLLEQTIKGSAQLAADLGMSWREFYGKFRDEYFGQYLQKANGNQCEAARLANIHRNTVGRICRRTG